MKELLKRKTVKIGIVVIILAVAIGIVGINVHSAQRQREYGSHIEAAEKYLTELDYEQAIVEYTLALEIEPNQEEVRNVLEQTYLDYAQSLADAGEYEKAVEVLEEGYAQIGRESLRERMEELKNIQEQMVVFPFELTDITIMGYDLLEDHFEEVCAAYGCPIDSDLTRSSHMPDSSVDNEYGRLDTSVVVEDGSNSKTLSFWEENFGGDNVSYASYAVGRLDDENFRAWLSFDNASYIAADLGFYGINIPLKPECSDEDWNRIMQVQEIKEKGKRSGPDDDGSTSWFFQTKWGRGIYRERDIDGGYGMHLEIIIDEQTTEYSQFTISRMVIEDSVLYTYTYIDGRKKD